MLKPHPFSGKRLVAQLDRFVTNERGAAALDWVILAFGVFGLGLAIFSVVDTISNGAIRPTPHATRAPDAPAQTLPEDVATLRALPPLYPYFSDDWRGDMIARFAVQSDADLLEDYAAQHDVATGPVNALIGADMLVLIEAEMRLRGLPLPDGDPSAAALHARLAPPLQSP